MRSFPLGESGILKYVAGATANSSAHRFFSYDRALRAQFNRLCVHSRIYNISYNPATAVERDARRGGPAANLFARSLCMEILIEDQTIKIFAAKF